MVGAGDLNGETFVLVGGAVVAVDGTEAASSILSFLPSISRKQ